jgi:hypothetical protein
MNSAILLAPPVLGFGIGAVGTYAGGFSFCQLVNRKPWILVLLGGFAGMGVGVYVSGVMRTGSLLTVPV